MAEVKNVMFNLFYNISEEINKVVHICRLTFFFPKKITKNSHVYVCIELPEVFCG